MIATTRTEPDPVELTVNLMNGNAVVDTVTLKEANDWSATVGNLEKKAGGKDIEYTWTEGSMPEGYKLTDTRKNGTVTTLTNTYAPEKVPSLEQRLERRE